MIPALIYVCITTVICIQYVPSFLNILVPRNKSRRVELLFQVEYFIDQEKYYHTIQFHLDIGLILAAITILSTESFCLSLAIHAFGMFKIARYIRHIFLIVYPFILQILLIFCFYSYRMEYIIDENVSNIFIKKHCIFYNNIVAAVNGHRRAIELVL